MRKQHFRIGIVALGMLLSVSVYGQKGERVESITVVMKTENWYKEQAALWQKEVEKNNKNAEAWHNYYAATRALKLMAESPEEADKYAKKCHEIADEAIAKIPETFEGNHIYWWDGNNEKARDKYLFKAYQINPNDPRAYDELLVVHEIERNTAEFERMAKKMVEANVLPAGILNWGYNVLSELDQNAIVFTAGDNDTYALWLTQSVFGVRKDVRVFNIYLFYAVPEYREKCLKELMITNFQSPKPDDKEAMAKCLNELVRVVGNKKPIYVSGSANSCLELFDEKDSFYLTGLSYKYAVESFDNISLIRRNYEHRYKLDYLDIQFTTHISDEIAAQFDALYLPSLIKLYCHYEVSEEAQKRDNALALIKVIAKRTGREEIVESLLKSGKN